MPLGTGHLPHRLMNSKTPKRTRVGTDYAGFTWLMYCITLEYAVPLARLTEAYFDLWALQNDPTIEK